MRLTRAEALEHPRVGDFWAVVDFLAESDETIRATVYAKPLPKPPIQRRWRR